MKKKIFDILNKLGVPCDLKGRLYIETALEIVNEKGIISITKELYPEVAKRLGTTPPRVEKAIRFAIEVCFSNTDNDVLFEVFGNTVKSKSRKCTNGRFIYGIKKYIDINYMEE